MPELPEVETVVRALRPNIIGRTITSVRNYWPKHIKTHSPEDFAGSISGQRVEALNRRAKYIVFSLSEGDSLIIHLRMTGHLSVVSAETEPDKYAHTVFGLDNGHEMRFRDMRKFGTVALVDDANKILGKLGPEPLEDGFTVAVLRERIAKRKTKLKPLLLNQTFVAGVGNIYADEALYDAKLDPRRTADTLTDDDIKRLHHAIRKVLALGIEREGASITNYVKPDGKKGDMQNAVEVFRRTGAPCYTCGTPIERIKLAQRSTHFCPNCQK